MPVHVREAGPLAALDVDRDLVVDRHPCHRHAVRHVRPGTLEQRDGARPLQGEFLQLQVVDGPDLHAGNFRYEHGRVLDGIENALQQCG